MISEQEARKIAEKKAGEKASACTYYGSLYVFNFGMLSNRYIAVSKEDGKTVSFTPAFDPIGFGESEAKIYPDYFK